MPLTNLSALTNAELADLAQSVINEYGVRAKTPVSIVAIVDGGGGENVSIQFSGPVEFTDGAGTDNALLIGGQHGNVVHDQSPGHVELMGLTLASIGGSAWELNGRPAWLRTPLVYPASGTVG